jgi:hypothetical protein
MVSLASLMAGSGYRVETSPRPPECSSSSM